MEPCKFVLNLNFLRFSLFFITILFCFSCNNNTKTNKIITEDSIVNEHKKIIEDPILPDSILATKKTVYITCDDGPNFGSNIVMNIAKEENIPVNFFVVGYQYTGQTGKVFAKQWARMHTQHGVEIYNHSFTHALNNHYEKYYANPDTVIYDFKRAQDSGKFNTMVCRTPGNNEWRTPNINHSTYKRYDKAVNALHDAGFMPLGWDNEWFHYKMKLRQTPEQMVADVENMFAKKTTFTPHHLILLSHDQSFADAVDSASLHEFIKILKSKPEYRFERISRYPKLLK